MQNAFNVPKTVKLAHKLEVFVHLVVKFDFFGMEFASALLNTFIQMESAMSVNHHVKLALDPKKHNA